jgi:exodeoxyribonuclease VII large subunit
MAETVLPRAYGVSEINNYLREYLAEDDLLADLLVQGELTSLKRHASGHIYFTLTEGGCSISGALFRNQADFLRFEPTVGMVIAVWGNIGYYERDGRTQLYARAFLPLGDGLAANQFEQLKQKLAAEGLFAMERKKQLPFLPKSVGVITGASSAAWADIERVAKARWPALPLKLYAATVQGVQAPESIVLALRKSDNAGHGLLILGRGGGASEDLAAFNSELVARTLADLQTPVISAVGHETDTTLADLVADVRAATPSHAAMLAVPEVTELLTELDNLNNRLQQAAQRQLAGYRLRLAALEASPALSQPQVLLQPMQQALAAADANLEQQRQSIWQAKQQALQIAVAKLESQSPLAILSRGYAVCRDSAGHSIRNAAETEIGQSLEVLLTVGSLQCKVEGKSNK